MKGHFVTFLNIVAKSKFPETEDGYGIRKA